MSVGGAAQLPRLALTAKARFGTLDIEAWQVTAAKRERVPVNATIQASGVEQGGPYALLLIEFPLPDEERMRVINDFVDHMNEGTAEQQQLLHERRVQVVSALSTVFVLNRVGRFEVRVRFHNAELPGWKGEIERSVTVDVVDEGSLANMVKALSGARKREMQPNR